MSSTEPHRWELIGAVVDRFYQRATADILIGFHFQRIEDFELHLPRIKQFWSLQLGVRRPPPGLSFDLIGVHTPLRITHGQLDRWLLIFQEVLQEMPLPAEFQQQWEAKLEHFRSIFHRHPHLFKS